MPFYDDEVPTGLINGTNPTFSLVAAPEPPSSLMLTRNGVVQTAEVDFGLSLNVINFYPGHVPNVGDNLRAWYRADEVSFIEEVPTGLMDGFNRIFMLSQVPIENTLVVIQNGILVYNQVGYVLAGNQITFYPPYTPQPGSTLLARYRVGMAASGGMWRDDIIQLIESRLGDRTNLETRIIYEMQALQSKLQEGTMLPWFLLRSLVFTTQAASGVVPTDFIREVDDQVSLWRKDGINEYPMDKEEYDFIRSRPAMYGTGQPSHYALLGQSFYFFQAPAQATTFRLIYYGVDIPLTSNVKNGWLSYASDYFIAEVGYQTARGIRDQEAAQWFALDRAEAWKRFNAHCVARQTAAMEAVYGGHR